MQQVCFNTKDAKDTKEEVSGSLVTGRMTDIRLRVLCVLSVENKNTESGVFAAT
jgi:hypothetical protein